jgi:hypothetical protein
MPGLLVKTFFEENSNQGYKVIHQGNQTGSTYYDEHVQSLNTDVRTP